VLFLQTADIDEKSIRRDNPDELVVVLAEAKVGTNILLVFCSVTNADCSTLQFRSWSSSFIQFM
jgi:hypothetical protein